MGLNQGKYRKGLIKFYKSVCVCVCEAGIITLAWKLGDSAA